MNVKELIRELKKLKSGDPEVLIQLEHQGAKSAPIHRAYPMQVSAGGHVFYPGTGSSGRDVVVLQPMYRENDNDSSRIDTSTSGRKPS